MQTVGEIYNRTLPKNEFPQFLGDDETERYALQNFRRQASNAALEEVKEVHKQVGFDAIERDLVNGLFNLFHNTFAPDEITKSMMKEMQEIVWRAMRSKLNLPKEMPKEKKAWTDALNDALHRFDTLGFRDVEGRMNNLQSVFDAMNKIIDTESEDAMLEALEKAGIDVTDTNVIERFKLMTQHLNSAAMGLFFTAADAKAALYDMFQKEGYGKMDSKGNLIGIDWTKLAGIAGSAADLRAEVHRILEGNGYSPSAIESIKDSFQDQFDRMTADIINKQLTQTDKMAAEATRKLLKEDPDVTKFLTDPKTGNVMKIEDWFKEAKIEDALQIAMAAKDKLDQLKYQPGVRAKVVLRLKDFFNKNYIKVENREAREAFANAGIAAPSGRPRGGQTPQLPPVAKGQLPASTTAAGALQTAKKLISPLQWIKDNGLHNAQDLYTAVEAMFAGRNIPDAERRHLHKEFQLLMDFDARAEKELQNREKAGNKNPPVRKSDLRRLAELYNLGAFGGNHEKLLNKIAGVDDLTQADIKDMEQIAAAASAMFRDLRSEMGGRSAEVTMAREFQRMQNALNIMVMRHLDNKTVWTKIAGWMRAYMDAMMSGFLMSIFNISRNIVGNSWSALGAAISGDKEARALNLANLKHQRKIFWAILKDVSINGQAYGNSLSDFSPSLNKLQQVKFGWAKDKTIAGNLATNMAATFFAPAKAGLNGVDSAFLLTSMNSHFNNIWFEVLTTKGGMSKKEAQEFMNEQLYGESFEQAKKKAKILLEKLNKKMPPKMRRKVIEEREIIITANELVKHNVVTGGGITNEVLEAALNSAYGVAGVGLGHTPNNRISETIANSRAAFRKKEMGLIEDRRWDKLAFARMGNMLFETMVLRFTGGALNWLKMTVQKGTGYPLFKSLFFGEKEWKSSNFKKNVGDKVWFTEGRPDDDMDYMSKEGLARQFTAMQLERERMARGFIGLVGIQGIGYLIKAAIEMGMGDDDDKEQIALIEQDIADMQEEYEFTSDQSDKADIKENIKTQKENAEELKVRNSLFAAVRKSDLAKKIFNVFAPDTQLAAFYIGADDRYLLNTIRYIQNTTGMRFGTATYLADAGRLAYQRDYNGAWGTLGLAIGSRFSAPAWRPVKETWQLAQWTATLGEHKFENEPYPNPQSFWEGLFGGGALEAVLNVGGHGFDPSVTLMPGVGYKSSGYLKAHGIETMEDLRDNPGWEELTKPNGQQIFNKESRQKALDFYDKYAAENWGDDKEKEKEKKEKEAEEK
jgi:hypothetical protein